ncbi:MAG: cytochrome c peroxidase [Planctomycetota bacterium]|jgi:cytochrome c peroxidase
MKSISTALLVACLSTACSGGEPELVEGAGSPVPQEFARIASDDAPYVIEWRPAGGEVPQNEPFDVEVRVLDKTTGAPIDDVELKVDAGMPHHGHGMNVVPEHSDTGEGEWLAQGLLFHMGGEWTVTFVGACAPTEPDAPEIHPSFAGFTPLGEAPDDPTNPYDTDHRAAHLGRWLFFDAGLSADGNQSCAGCHVPERGFQDGRRVAPGTLHLGRNTPTVVGAAWRRWFFWDGRADSLWSQALHPLEGEAEFGSSRVALAHYVAGFADLRLAYEELFGEFPDVSGWPADARPVSDQPEHPANVTWEGMADSERDAANRVAANLAMAIAAYERLLTPGEAPFDRAARGEQDPAWNRAAVEGFSKFQEFGCAVCHGGPSFTDDEFHFSGVPPREGNREIDPGRYGGIAFLAQDPFNSAGRYSAEPDGARARMTRSLRWDGDQFGEFKTPTLRNLRDTGPYMHAGQFESLEDVLDFYSTRDGALPAGHHGESLLQPIPMGSDDRHQLLAFLESLNGDGPPGELCSPPDGPMAP